MSTIDLVAIPPPDAVIDRFTAFEIACGRKSGLRLVREEGRIGVSIDPSRIERLGPVVEAAAIVIGAKLLLRHPQGDVLVPLGADLEDRPSGVWAAIGDAVDQDAVELSRGRSPAGDRFRHLRFETVDGVATVFDARPPRVEPTGGGPSGGIPTKYDDVDYHQGAAEEAGQPIEHAFAHMGLFLAWAIRRDFHEPAMFPPEHITAVKSGSWVGSDIADDVDGKLSSDMFVSEGAAFADARYRDYLQAFGMEFADSPDYGVPDDESSRRRIEPVLDDLYRAWVEAGRPEASDDTIEIGAGPMPELPDIPWDQIPSGQSAVIHPDGTWQPMEDFAPHDLPDLEALIPVDLIDGGLRPFWSSSATQQGSLLNRALRDLDVRPRDVAIASAMGGAQERTLSVSIYRVPGVSADRLFERFATVIFRPGRGQWQERTVHGRRVNWVEATLAPDEPVIAVAYWTRDEHVFHAAGERTLVESAIQRVGAQLDV